MHWLHNFAPQGQLLRESVPQAQRQPAVGANSPGLSSQANPVLPCFCTFCVAQGCFTGVCLQLWAAKCAWVSRADSKAQPAAPCADAHSAAPLFRPCACGPAKGHSAAAGCAELGRAHVHHSIHLTPAPSPRGEVPLVLGLLCCTGCAPQPPSHPALTPSHSHSLDPPHPSFTFLTHLFSCVRAH